MNGEAPIAAEPQTGGWRPERCERVALVLQGGGALGAYQAGVYQALHEARIEPDWISGVSIGAINSAIIAGNPPERRLERLRIFWERITDRRIWAFTPDGDVFRKARNTVSSFSPPRSASPASSRRASRAPGSARRAPATPRAITTPRPCARPCASSSISSS
jgi:predicted acylesterase/phospholipase RssA